jgi:ATP-dependent exoDNAse (exonuclease V) beta subunit
MTIHKAKGLQFDYVFIPEIGCGTGKSKDDDNCNAIFMSWGNDRNPWNLSIGVKTLNFRDWTSVLLEREEEQNEYFEEMRLLYVAMTRAKKGICVIDIKDRDRRSNLGKAFWDSLEQNNVKEIVRDIGSVDVVSPTDIVEDFEKLLKVTGKNIEPTKNIQRYHASDVMKICKDEMRIRKPSELVSEVDSKSSYELGREIGIVCHEALKNVDFNLPNAWDILKTSIVHLGSMNPRISNANLEKIEMKSKHILEGFWKSDIARKLSSKKLYREVPVFALIDDTLIDGVIDLLWEEEDKLVVADYKTDEGSAEDIWGKYRDQINCYCRALHAVTGRKVSGYIISLKLLEMIPVY